MINLITPFISRVIALLFSAFVGFFVGAGTTPLTGIVTFSLILLWFFAGQLTKDLPYTLPFVRNLKTFSGRASKIIDIQRYYKS